MSHPTNYFYWKSKADATGFGSVMIDFTLMQWWVRDLKDQYADPDTVPLWRRDDVGEWREVEIRRE